MIREKEIPHLSIIKACQANNRDAQHQLYKLYSKQMFNVCYRIVNQHEEAEDVLQESFVKMFRQLDSFREESSFGSWFKRIVVNHSLNYVKKRSQQNLELKQLANDTEAEFSNNESEEKGQPEFTVAEIQNAMELLPEGYRIIFSLFLFEGYTHYEIASELGISTSTSKSQLNRAKKKIREILEQNLIQ